MQSTAETPPAVSPSVSVSPPHPQIANEQHVILRGVSWATYESLLADFADRSAPHFAYDQGVLEIMPLSFPHENMNRLLQDLFSAAAEEMDIDFVNAGSTTFKRVDLAKGFEPDTCFYIANAERMRSKRDVDLTVDPPPDLVIEIDITSLSLNKFPIYAQIGVPEIWRYDGNQVTIFKLANGEYLLQKESPALPGLTSEVSSRFLGEGQRMTRLAWLRSIREWARQQRSQHTLSKEGDR
jgi:Uma2 family endonuclease